ncbi:unnamed protein product [Callosobruchus maculatus]|uniref:Uncharacterized protein n=1 Tax=Callosobruchus maculatus TaxID=64391 RepID=A0A653C1E4_CALMS|nr:unnamed protein product [Callosobruchus maculatus]
MDSNHPTPINEGEINKNDEPDDRATIKIEQKDPDYEALHDSLRSEKVKIKVEGVSSKSTIEYVGIEDNKEVYETALLTDKMEIKDETDVADYVVLKRIKDEPNIEQWDEGLTREAVVQVKMEQQAAVKIKLEGVDTKTEDTDFTQLNEEVDIKPDDHLSQGEVDR